MNFTSFEAWLIRQVHDVLSKRASSPPWMLWCDPRQDWLELLERAARDGEFDLWACDPAPEAHGELILRHRFAGEELAPRVVWLPVERRQIGWFKVFELHASVVWERSLLEALRDYGVDIRRGDEADLLPLLAPHTREWFAEPRERWSELTPGNAKGALVDDERVFSALAGPEGAFDAMVAEGRFEIFARRAAEDFGLPRPESEQEPAWRIAALARLLATEAAEASPGCPPSEGERIIPPGARRERALGLLRRWQRDINWLSSFEALVPKADAQLGLVWWARNAAQPPRSRASRAVEQAVFEQVADRLERIDGNELLVREMERVEPTVSERCNGFWASVAQERVPWLTLASLARAASTLAEHRGAEQGWRRATDAVTWYTERGWRLDAEGEGLFVEDDGIPSALQRVRARLRAAYLRSLDRIGRRFSELMADDPAEVLALSSAGEIALQEVERRKGPMALVFLDACRYDLGCRLVELLNRGEPHRRAEIRTAIAPVPSITALGMAFALPMSRENLSVTLQPEARGLRVEADGFVGDLAIKQQREQWLRTKLRAVACIGVDDVIADRFEGASPRSKRLLVVHGMEFDTAGHEGQLELRGADEDLDRYAKAIRRLRDKGYNRVVVVTDHGFFHWQPEEHEVEGDKPAGTVRWSSRRAIVGEDLSHRTALLLTVSRSILQAAIPRSINAWRTYGGLGFFHGGATLQELVIPVVSVSWPAKATKIGVVLKPIVNISSRRPRVEVQAASDSLFATEGQVGRRVVVKVQDSMGRVVFRHAEPELVKPPETTAEREPQSIQLELVPSPPEGLAFGVELVAILRDADDEEELARETVALKVEIDDWD